MTTTILANISAIIKDGTEADALYAGTVELFRVEASEPSATVYDFEDGISPIIGPRTSKFETSTASPIEGTTSLNYTADGNFLSGYLDVVEPRTTKVGAWIRSDASGSVGGAGLLICGDSTAVRSGYTAHIDFRDPSLNLRTAYTDPSGKVTIPGLQLGTAYWMELEGLDADTVEARLYDAPNGNLLGSVQLADSSLTSGNVGCHGYNPSTIDNLTIYNGGA